jgi:DNA-binding CsgD family transcriptional regulator
LAELFTPKLKITPLQLELNTLTGCIMSKYCQNTVMNQFLPKSAFGTQQQLPEWTDFEQLLPLRTRLRRLAARFNMHHAFIHRLGPPETLLAAATYGSTLRNLDASSWTLGDLVQKSILDRLLSGNYVVQWQHDEPCQKPKPDPLTRLQIRSGVSVPFHNALGNHVALTLCDSLVVNVDTTNLMQLALPLIDTVLSAERSHNTVLTPLSQRETGCLQWAAAGKTSIETAIILGLSPHTVNQYLTAATVKLKAVNRTHAVTKAVRLGLIDLSVV